MPRFRTLKLGVTEKNPILGADRVSPFNERLRNHDAKAILLENSSSESTKNTS